MSENSNAETIYIPITGKTIGIIFVAVATLLSSDHLVNWYGHDTDACYASTDGVWLENEVAKLDDRVTYTELAVSSINQTEVDSAEHQRILERKVDKCRTRVAGLEEKVNGNKYLIAQCLRITGAAN